MEDSLKRDLELLVLSGLKFGKAERWINSLPQIHEDYFQDDRLKLFKVFLHVFQVTTQPCDESTFNALVAGMKDTASALEISSCYKALTTEPTEPEFKFAVHRLQDAFLNQEFMQTMLNTLRINSQGLSYGGQVLEGREAALTYLRKQLQEVTFTSNESNMFDAMLTEQDFMHEYEYAKSGVKQLVKTWISPIDRIITGMDKGDLIFIQGFTGEGKTQMCGNIGHNVVTHEGNVLYATTETSPDRIRRRFVCRHSMEDQFRVKVPYNGIKHGTLNAAQEASLREVYADLSEGRRTGKYGAFALMVPRSLEHLREHIRRAKQLYGKVDLVVLDYLALISRSAERTDLVQLVRDAKNLAIEEEVPLISPWQTSKEAWLAALQEGHYVKGSYSETKEVENAADIILTMLRDPSVDGILNCKFTKCRDEAEGEPFELSVESNFAYVGEQRGRKFNFSV